MTGRSSAIPDTYEKLRKAGAVARETLKAAATKRFGVAVADIGTQARHVTLVEICAQLRGPLRNGGRDAAGLLVHLQHDASLNGFIPRGWVPRAGRRPRQL
jgi:hypothetical protein